MVAIDKRCFSCSDSSAVKAWDGDVAANYPYYTLNCRFQGLSCGNAVNQNITMEYKLYIDFHSNFYYVNSQIMKF